MTKEISILDKYNDDALNLSSTILDEYTKAALKSKDNKVNIEYYISKYISEYVYKQDNLDMHYQLIGYLSKRAKDDYSIDEIMDKFNISNKILNETNNYTNIIDFMDDAVTNAVINIMYLLVNRAIKNRKFDF